MLHGFHDDAFAAVGQVVTYGDAINPQEMC